MGTNFRSHSVEIPHLKIFLNIRKRPVPVHNSTTVAGEQNSLKRRSFLALIALILPTKYYMHRNVHYSLFLSKTKAVEPNMPQISLDVYSKSGNL